MYDKSRYCYDLATALCNVVCVFVYIMSTFTKLCINTCISYQRNYIYRQGYKANAKSLNTSYNSLQLHASAGKMAYPTNRPYSGFVLKKISLTTGLLKTYLHLH